MDSSKTTRKIGVLGNPHSVWFLPISDHFRSFFQGLNMRIGLHHGEFAAGVIGSNQLRFDIWGEDVLMGNQMESDGEPGRICCSATFVEVSQRHL